MLSRKWRCSWSSGDRWCPNYTWVIINFIANQGACYIRDFTVSHGMHLTPAGSGLGHNNWTSSSPAGTGSTRQEPCSADRPSDNPHRNSRTWYIKTAQDININHTIHSLTKAYQSSLIKAQNHLGPPAPLCYPIQRGPPCLAGGVLPRRRQTY